MVRFINKVTGGEMFVAEDRVEEYKAAGHKPAAAEAPEKPAERKQTRKGTTRK